MVNVLDLVEQTVSSVDEVCSSLDDTDWDKPTDLPGWSVKDNLAHLAHYEATAIGRPTPEDIDVSAYADRLTDDFQRANERGVEARRARTGTEVLAEFREVATEHIKRMRNLGDLSAEVTLPAGTFAYESILPIRVTDLYYHEQDIRRAVGKPGHMGGAVARAIFDRFANSFGYILVKRAGAPEGTRARLAIGEPGQSVDVVVRDGRGTREAPQGDPDMTFTGDFETFLCLVGGRWTPATAIADGRWTATGDAELVAKVHENIAVVP